jgi:DNA-3-methyladenine glycosylase
MNPASPTKLTTSFFTRDVLEVAPDLLGKIIIRKMDDGTLQEFTITEVEAYRGEEDLACHASKGRTPRTEVMYLEGGYVYVYLIYGMYYMLNFVTSTVDIPQAVLIRGVDNVLGSGRVGRLLQINKSHNRQNLITSDKIWVEDHGLIFQYTAHPRVGIDYAGEIWKNKPWRYCAVQNNR